MKKNYEQHSRLAVSISGISYRPPLTKTAEAVGCKGVPAVTAAVVGADIVGAQLFTSVRASQALINIWGI